MLPLAVQGDGGVCVCTICIISQFLRGVGYFFLLIIEGELSSSLKMLSFPWRAAPRPEGGLRAGAALPWRRERRGRQGAALPAPARAPGAPAAPLPPVRCAPGVWNVN